MGGDFNYDDSANDFTWRANDSLTVLGNFNIVAANFANNGTVNADTITIEVTNFVNDIQNSGTVSSGSLNFILTDDFTHESDSFANFNFSNLAITTEGTFTNNDTIAPTGNLTITANSFDNTVGVVADAFTLSVAGDFLNNGTITANAFNLQVGGDFSYDDSASDFTWGANDILTVSGSADITTNNYTQYGAINVAGVLTINANNYTYDRPNSDFVLAENDSLSIADDFTIATNNYINRSLPGFRFLVNIESIPYL